MTTVSPKRAALVTRLVTARLKACRFSGSTSALLGLAHAHLDRRAEVLGLLLHLLQQLADVGRRRLLAAVALGEGQVVLQHVLHLVDVVLQRRDLAAVAEQGELQLEAGQHGAQVVADARQHGGALLDVMADAVAHLQERLRGLAHLARAARAEVGRHGPALAEGVGRLGQPQDGPDLVAQEQDGDRQQHHRGAHHPDQEDVRVGGVGLAALGDEAQDGVVELDADLDVPRLADGVDPERPLDVAARISSDSARSSRSKNGLGCGGRQVAGRQDREREIRTGSGAMSTSCAMSSLKARLS